MNDELLTSALDIYETDAAPTYETSERFLRSQIQRVRTVRRLLVSAATVLVLASTAAIWIAGRASSPVTAPSQADDIPMVVPPLLNPSPTVTQGQEVQHTSGQSAMIPSSITSDPHSPLDVPSSADSLPLVPPPPATVVPLGPPSYTVEFRRGLDSARAYESAGRLDYAAAQYGSLADFARMHGDSAAARFSDSCRRAIRRR
jgi:hypothetical protein